MIVLLTKDLMFASVVSEAAKATAAELTVVSGVAKLVDKAHRAEARLVILDLVACGDAAAETVRELKRRRPETRVVAYGPHVDVERLSTASEAGADLVLTRGEFHARVAEILA